MKNTIRILALAIAAHVAVFAQPTNAPTAVYRAVTVDPNGMLHSPAVFRIPDAVATNSPPTLRQMQILIAANAGSTNTIGSSTGLVQVVNYPTVDGQIPQFVGGSVAWNSLTNLTASVTNAVTSINSATGTLTLSPGANVQVGTAGQTITVGATNMVTRTGTQTIAGAKTFSASPTVPLATASGHAVSLQQITNLLVDVESVGGPYLDHFASMTSDTLYRGSAGAITTNTVVDALRTTQTISTSVTDYRFRATYTRNTTGADFAYASSNPSVATVNSAGLASWVSDGSANITVTLGDFSVALPRNFSSVGTRTETNLVAGVASYFRHAVTDPIDDAITADAGANDDELFDTKDWVGHTYARNASCWAYTATGGTTPWTGIPVWRTGKTGVNPSIGGALISSNVVAFAWHNRPAIGSQVRWLGSNGTVYLRTITATARVGTGDACVALVDSPLPSVVAPVKILANTYTSHLITTGSRGTQLPAININKNLQASVHEHIETAGGYELFRSPLIASRAPYYYLPVGGDSGSPVLFVVGSQLVLVTTWLGPTAGSTFQASGLLTAAVSALGGVQPTPVNLSSYPANTPPAP